MQNTIYFPFVAIALTMFSCGAFEHGDAFSNHCQSAFLLTTNDTITTRSYYGTNKPEYTRYYPSVYLQEMCWYAGQDEKTKHSVEENELHLQRETNNGEIIVIEGHGLYINDKFWSYYAFADPADSVQYITVLGEKHQVVSNTIQAPYDLEDVIEQLELNYPKFVHRFADNEEHHIANNALGRYDDQYPYIYIP